MNRESAIGIEQSVRLAAYLAKIAKESKHDGVQDKET